MQCCHIRHGIAAKLGLALRAISRSGKSGQVIYFGGVRNRFFYGYPLEITVGFLSDLFSRNAIGTQGKELAQQFSKRLTKERLGDAKRVAAEFDILSGNALSYQRKVNLGVLGKSHLVNSLQWTLIDDGYPEDFAKEIGGQLAMKLAASE